MLRALDSKLPRILLPATACLLVAGCGGRAATPPKADSATRAERLDGHRAPTQPKSASDESAPTAFAPEVVAEENLDSGASLHEDSKGSEGSEDSEVPGVTERSDPVLRHILRRGQTLYSLSRLYDVDVKELIRVNGIVDPSKLHAGRVILIPGARAPRSLPSAPGAPGARAARGPHMNWPLHGAITAAYGRRGKRGHHSGLDIDGHKGDPILAAASGTVIRAGIDVAYGRIVIIDHGDGLTTLYAHASRLLVAVGDRVRAGERIAEVGGSGNARGTHLHFEVRREDRPIDPMPLLRGTAVLTAGTH